ncbi:MAG: hypothetical protein KGJ32_07470 [Xanthomonadaceae bacterium]|nr:hypothetical protein [Xanthomonadaceae bacterium]
MFILLITLLVAKVGQTAFCGSAGAHAVFKALDGEVIVLDPRTGTLRTPRSQGTVLRNCSDKFQTCLTDHHGFAFAYFRNCNDVDYRRLRFPPKIVSVLDNATWDTWMVFDASPNYMFHYAGTKGIVGIYVGPTVTFDFRSLFHDRNLRLDKLDAMEYRITPGSDAIAACKEQ